MLAAAAWRLSEQDFFFCRTQDASVLRDCGGGWTLKEGMLAFIEAQGNNELPVTEACLPFTPTINAGGAATCKRTCTTTMKQLQQGEYRSRPLGNIWDMQRHIRQHGSIVCRMQLFSDIRPFFVDNPLGVYNGPGGLRGDGCALDVRQAGPILLGTHVYASTCC
jgi:hypothetical protein